jgi:hypothetical protein
MRLGDGAAQESKYNVAITVGVVGLLLIWAYAFAKDAHRLLIHVRALLAPRCACFLHLLWLCSIAAPDVWVSLRSAHCQDGVAHQHAGGEPATVRRSARALLHPACCACCCLVPFR